MAIRAWMCGALRRGALLVVAAAMLSAAAPSAATAEPTQPGADRLVRACTPELLYSFRPGREMDARSTGSGFAANVVYTDADGSPRPPTTALVEWSARGVVDEPGRDTGVGPAIAGNLDVTIATASGERLTFTATCIAAVIGNPFGLVVYANGLTTGWPGSAVRRTLVHFEAFTFHDETEAYVALVDGTDCRLNFDALLVTGEPYVSGTATFSGLPSLFTFAETSCANRFGSPFPALRAPGDGGHQ